MRKMFHSLDLLVLSCLFLRTASDPVLVTDVKCHATPSNVQCSWIPANDTSNVRFYYWLWNVVDGSQTEEQECSSYMYTNGRTICDLKATIDDFVYITVNATRNNISVKKQFKLAPINEVRPSALIVTVKKIGDKVNITWNDPGILDLMNWKFRINYTVCNDQKDIEEETGETSHQLNLVPHCQYCVAVQAVALFTSGESPWSNKTCVDAVKDPNPMVYAAIFIPLVIACLAFFIFAFCRKNRRNIFPKVPKPRDLLSDISDNNNKGKVQDLYVPAAEEENCKITLVVDPQVDKLDC